MIRTLAAALATSTYIVALATPAAAQTREYNIPAGSLKAALDAYVRQSGRQVVYRVDEVRSARSSGVRGSLSTDAALAALLAGSGFTTRIDGKLVAIVKVGNGSTDNSVASSGEAGSARQAPEASSQVGEERSLDPVSTHERPSDQGQILVTGTRVRGTSPASPIITYGIRDIEDSGFGSTEEFVDSIPQNFGAGASQEIDFSGRAQSNLNVGLGAGVNLRGLGNESTLVLLNGRRIAPAGFGNFVDVSMIPLAAVERVDVLTDGASAIYGSDAVAGVVNFWLRRDFEGVETRVRRGFSTQGGGDELSFGATAGHNWSSGNVIASYEYYERDPLRANQRAFTEDASEPTELLPATNRHSALVSGNQDVGERARFFLQGIYSRRESERNFFNVASMLPERSSAESEQYVVTGGVNVGFLTDWESELAVTYSRNDTFAPRLDPASGIQLGNTTNQLDVFAFDLQFDGSLVSLPAGRARAAVGATYREEGFESPNAGGIDQNRSVRAVFGEIFVPLFSQDNALPGLNRLELTGALRHERYSDFGSTTDPKVGLVLSPFQGLTFRGTWGTSFRAPLLFQLVENNRLNFATRVPDPSSPSGTTIAVSTFGNNAALQPEKANVWTAGFDLAPRALSGFQVSGTYFDISYRNRIASAPYFEALTQPDVYAPVIIRDDGSQAFRDQVAEIVAFPAFLNFLPPGQDPLDATAVIDAQLKNLSSLSVRGTDLTARYNGPMASGRFGLSLNASYILDYVQQFTDTAPAIENVDTIFNPVDLRIRGGATWSDEHWSGALFVNYIDGYRDNRAGQDRPISSWTTVDANLRYDTGDTISPAALRNVVISIGVRNILDDSPPFVSDAQRNINFDPSNANPLGRFITFEVVKRW